MSASCCLFFIPRYVQYLPHVYLFSFLLSTVMTTVRPPKRRRTGYRPGPMVDDSDLSLDTAMYIQSEGGESILVPVRPDAPEANVVPEPAPEPPQPAGPPNAGIPTAAAKSRWLPPAGPRPGSWRGAQPGRAVAGARHAEARRDRRFTRVA